MRTTLLLITLLFTAMVVDAQDNPAITAWMQNTTGIMGRHYVSGNSTPIEDNVLANVQKVQYSDNWSYINATGIPAYVSGPFLDGNPSLATNQNAIFRFPLYPVKNEGTPTSTNAGNIGVFINGVALFDFRDGVGWNSNTNSLCGGPGNTPCPGGPMAQTDWSRDAIPAEMAGFDCSKAHPAMGNYHHHQNPSAFNLDIEVVSTICNLYDADGLYAIDSTQHSPLLGFAYDGFPIYGAYGFENADGTGEIVRIKSGYQARNITSRTHWADGTDVDNGPDISTTYPIGYFREDYEFIQHSGEEDYLDEHNGRFCVTPEYPEGIYCYFSSVDENWNSTYPYVVGPTFYGEVVASKVNSITEPVDTYVPVSTSTSFLSDEGVEVNIFPNPAVDLVAIQIAGLNKEDLNVEMFDISGKLVERKTLYQGSTIVYFDTQTYYEGIYLVRVSGTHGLQSKQIAIVRY